MTQEIAIPIDEEDFDPINKTAIVLVRRKIKGLEKPHLWYCALQNPPENTRLIMPLRQPFMNFKEARAAFAKALLQENPLKLQFMAFKGSRTFFPTQAQLNLVTEVTPPPK